MKLKDKIIEKLDLVEWVDEHVEFPLSKGWAHYSNDWYQKYFGSLVRVRIAAINKTFIDAEKSLNYIMSQGFSIIQRSIEKRATSKNLEDNFEILHLERKIVMSYVYDTYLGAYNSIFYISPIKENKEFVKTLISELLDNHYEPDKIEEKKNNKFYMVAQNSQELYNMEVSFSELPLKDERFDLYYGKNFPYDHIKDFVTKKTDNLLLLHGEPGTGKSNFIKHLILKSKRPVLYVPPTMLSVLSTPGFINYTMKNKGSILIIEDAEEVISKQRNSATNNLLGLTDGFLKDVLDLKIICTFNCGIKDIDDALLRKGRLYFEYKFGKLSVEDAENLSDFLELDVEVEEPLTLANLFNLDKKTTITDSFVKRQIGFGVA